MAALSNEQKNENILSRFDGGKSGTRVRRYIATVDDKQIGMVVMNGEGPDEAEYSCRCRFGGRFGGLIET